LISLVFDDTPSPLCVLGATFLGVHVMLAMLCLYTALCLYFLALYVRVTIRSIACLGYCNTVCEGLLGTVRHVVPEGEINHMWF
jgi:hypothetical protein